MLEYVHFVPGRLRLKISELRNRQRAGQAEAYVATIPVVKSVVANPTTGSLTISFERNESATRDLWNRLCALGYALGPCPEPATIGLVFIDNFGGKGLGRTVLTAVLEAVVQQSAQALVRAFL